MDLREEKMVFPEAGREVDQGNLMLIIFNGTSYYLTKYF
jgi:hypothetical protein